jgi:hypothetical protein
MPSACTGLAGLEDLPTCVDAALLQGSSSAPGRRIVLCDKIAECDGVAFAFHGAIRDMRARIHSMARGSTGALLCDRS